MRYQDGLFISAGQRLRCRCSQKSELKSFVGSVLWREGSLLALFARRHDCSTEHRGGVIVTKGRGVNGTVRVWI